MTEGDIDGDGPRGLRLMVAGALLIMVVGGVADLVLDAPDDLGSVHVLLELFMIAFGLATAAMLARGWSRAERSLVETRHALAERQAERDEWRERSRAALEGFAHAIDERFDAWGLTPTEREIALLLLEGKSHKQIAYATGRGERTVRQHAVSVYEKSGLAGRAELSAFFLEGLMPPHAPRVDARVDG
jgi:DNA-binding NarL/FixJ family response regulator